MSTITARELREHDSPRPDVDYFDIAVRAARRQATQVRTHAHWNTVDAPMHRDEQQAACGDYVPLSRFSGEPTCPACRQQQAIFEALEF